jgi:hypothetical protein
LRWKDEGMLKWNYFNEIKRMEFEYNENF